MRISFSNDGIQEDARSGRSQAYPSSIAHKGRPTSVDDLQVLACTLGVPPSSAKGTTRLQRPMDASCMCASNARCNFWASCNLTPGGKWRAERWTMVLLIR